MSYQFRIESYRRRFYQPLQTRHGTWTVREGLILYLQTETSELGVGEIAPLPWFGTETLAEAIALCNTLPNPLSDDEIRHIPNTHPCCQFGFGCAQAQIAHSGKKLQTPILSPEKICGLLPAGDRALSAWSGLWSQGHRTFKWKIGVLQPEDELQLFQQLCDQLPPTAKLRLDANGGLTMAIAQHWLEQCDRSKIQIEYLEQPLPPNQFEQMLALGDRAHTPLALDESVATLSDWQDCIDRRWPRCYVIKPAIAGFPSALKRIGDSISNPIIFSSVFETEVGKQASLQLAQSLSTPGYALGFGVDHWLEASPKVSISNSIFS